MERLAHEVQIVVEGHVKQLLAGHAQQALHLCKRWVSFLLCLRIDPQQRLSFLRYIPETAEEREAQEVKYLKSCQKWRDWW